MFPKRRLRLSRSKMVAEEELTSFPIPLNLNLEAKQVPSGRNHSCLNSFCITNRGHHIEACRRDKVTYRGPPTHSTQLQQEGPLRAMRGLSPAPGTAEKSELEST